MIPDILNALKEKIATEESLTPEKRAELQGLVDELGEGLSGLPLEQKKAVISGVATQASGNALDRLDSSKLPNLEAFGGLAGLTRLVGGKTEEEAQGEPSDPAKAKEPPIAGIVRGINDTLLRFETAHPTLTANTNRLADLLASLGI